LSIQVRSGCAARLGVRCSGSGAPGPSLFQHSDFLKGVP
jgi:hypothetical protein